MKHSFLACILASSFMLTGCASMFGPPIDARNACTTGHRAKWPACDRISRRRHKSA